MPSCKHGMGNPFECFECQEDKIEFLESENVGLRKIIDAAKHTADDNDWASDLLLKESARVKELEAKVKEQDQLLSEAGALILERYDRVKELEAAQNNATQTRVCHWESEDDDEGTYQGECGVLWYIPEGNPKENKMNYCPECGGVLIYGKQEEAG